MKIYPIFFIPLFILASAIQSFGQKTGSFEETISFNGENRTLACYVPPDYDVNKEYRLIIALHGLGDNASNYRNALINSLKWQTIFTQTIIVCPDGGEDQNSDFHTPSGDEQIIQEAINFASSTYSIDASEMILQGFSLGGRSALKYGLEHTATFKGVLLCTPAVQGIADVLNDPNIGFGFDYPKASQIPIFISYGASDQLYVDAIGLTIDKLIENDAQLAYEKVPGLGHSIANSSIIGKSISFFNSPIPTGVDVRLRKVELPSITCDTKLSPSCLIQNTGSTNITEIQFDYEVAGTKASYTWTGTLNSYQHQYITIPDITGAGGSQTLQVELVYVNNGALELSSTNNSANTEVYVTDQALSIPLMETFEGQSDAWTNDETGSLFTWYTDDVVGHKSNQSVANFNTILIFYTAGYEESFKSPVLDLTKSDAPSMAFDVAFNYHKYTPPYFTADAIFADTLIVSISIDCGQSYTELYRKGGAELATVYEPILNPLSVEACFFKPTDEQWRTEAINLEDYKNEKEAIIKFAYKSGLGGNIYIDNVNFDRALSLPRQVEANSFTLYPNPATNRVTINFDSEGQHDIRVVDVFGHLINSFQSNSDYQLDVSQYPLGMYTIEVLCGGNRHVQKLIKAD